SRPTHLLSFPTRRSSDLSSLGITVSVGVSLTKSLAKIAANYHKPSGITVIDAVHIAPFLKKIPVKNIWGIGEHTGNKLYRFNIRSEEHTSELQSRSDIVC